MTKGSVLKEVRLPLQNSFARLEKLVILRD